MNDLLILPILIPMSAAALMLLAHRRTRVQRAVAYASTSLQFVVALILLFAIHQNGIQTSALGGWPARFGITLVADTFSALMVLLSGIVGLACAVYSGSDIDRKRRAAGFYPLMQILLMGANESFLTGDLFNLYVWFEVLLISSFVLLVLGNERPQMEGALKYVTMNLISSMLFLTAIGILYGAVSALNMADISQRLPGVPPSINRMLAALFIVAFGIKAAVFPLFFWLPDSYHTPSATVTALFAALLTKVGIYSMIRVFTLFFPDILMEHQTLLLIVAVLTMVIGVLGAVAQGEIRRILAFHSVSQMGYIVMGFGLFTSASLAGAILFTLHHAIVKSNLFLISGAIHRRGGSTTLKPLGDLAQREPMLAILFLVTAFSLVGSPPLSGFWAKLSLVRGGLEIGTNVGFYVILISLIVSVFTLISMTKIWIEAFWKPVPEGAPAVPPRDSRRRQMSIYFPIVMLTFVSGMIGLVPEPLLILVSDAAEQLIEPDEYVRAVLGASAP